MLKLVYCEFLKLKRKKFIFLTIFAAALFPIPMTTFAAKSNLGFDWLYLNIGVFGYFLLLPTVLTSTTMKRVNGEKYSYFSCYGYSKGKCKKPNGISSLVLEKEVLASIKEILDTKDIVYELREYQPTEQFDERKAITEQLESLTGKEERIKASYREGIDTLEEYKANKAIIQKERESLEQQLQELKKAAHKSDRDPADAMLQKVRSVYDILISNNYTYIQKNEALKQIIDKIIYDRKNNSLKIYFFLYR